MKTNFKIISVNIDGIRNAKMELQGICKDKDKISVLVDGKERKFEEKIILDKKYVVNRIKKIKSDDFNIYVCLEKKDKIVEVYYNNKFILKQNVSILSRVLFRIKIRLRRGFNIFKRLPKIIVKTIKLMWVRHHFLIPPRMIKQYLKSFSNNVESKNVDELFYNPLVDEDYRKWLKEQEISKEHKKFSYQPLISIVIPVYNVSEKLLRECLDSILNQSYDNFEICLSDDASSKKETISVLKEYENKYEKVKVVYRKKNGHISEATNSALELAKGEFIGLVDNDDVLDRDALYYMVEKLNDDKNLDLIYSDEDKLDYNGERCFPHFKPDFSLDTFLSSNYFCHFTVIRKSIIDKIGGFRGEYNGAQDYDLFLRVIDETKNIGHVSKILYHWRMTEGSTSSGGSHKNYAYDAGKRALEDYFKRNHIMANVHLIGSPEMYRIEYLYKKEPKISIIIPTKDKKDVLDTCLKSIYEKTEYSNYEVIVVDNNSREEETFALMNSYKNKHNNFKVKRLECEFNYSYINNEAAKEASGEYIVFLNNDTEVITSSWLHDMVGYASQKHIGCVGAKLLYPNQTIQHSGVVVGVGGIAMHAFVSTGRMQYGYFGRLVSVYDWSCVTAACLMVKKSKYLSVGGLEEDLKVAYNDVDFNLKLLDSGYYNVVLPNVELFHYESLSRGNDMREDQIKRFKKETDYMCDKWGKKLLRDKFYNDNMSYDYAFRLDRKSEK